jgi:hypothetical protein
MGSAQTGFFQTIWNFLTITDTHNNTLLNQILQYALWAWSFRPSLTSDIIMIVTLCTLVFTIYIILSKQQSTTHVSAPSHYTTGTNISVWLGQFEDYFDNAKITKDKSKQDMLLKKIDRTDRHPLCELIKTNEIQSYEQLADMVKTLYSTDGTLTQQNVFDFVNYYQNNDQSLTKYYANLRELAHKAFPHMRPVDQQREISQQFAKGVDNHFIKLELLKRFAKNPKIDLLALALKIQKDMGDSIQDYSNSRNAIEVNHIVQKQANKTTKAAQQTESSCPPCDQSTTNRFLNDPRNNNPILCYFCGDTSHTITNCIHYKKQQEGIKERREAHELNRHVQHQTQELAQQFNAPNTQKRSNFSNNNQQQRSNYYTQRNNYSNSNSTNNNN